MTSPSDGPTSHSRPAGVIVVGMHRSATSLTTSVLAGAGWSTSSRPLVGITRSQPRGHFEDLYIHRLHVQLLRANDLGWDAWRELRRLRGHSLSLEGLASSLDDVVDDLRAGRPWVWKNPRASLIVEQWAERLPESQIVLCVRKPSEVADSLLRRGNSLRISGRGRVQSAKRVFAAVSLWHSYSLPVYKFARKNPGRVVIMQLPSDLPALAAATQPSLFEPELMKGSARWEVRLIAGLNVAAQLLYRRIVRMRDPDALAALLTGPPSRP